MKRQICFSRKIRILKISDFIAYKNALFVRKSLKKEKLFLFNDMFALLNTNHDYTAKGGPKNILDNIQVNLHIMVKA